MDEGIAETATQSDVLADGAIERITGTLGRPLFEFLINDRVDSLSDGSASAESMTAARELDAFLMREYEGKSNAAAWGEVLKGHLTDTATTPQPVALTVRQACGGMDPIPTSSDAIEQLLLDLAVHAYPSFLLPDEVELHIPRWAGFGSIRATASIYRDSLREQFETALAADPLIAKTFTHHAEGGGAYAMVMCSTGRGGSIQLSMIAHQVLSAAWRGAKPSPSEFAERALAQLRLIRSALAKEVNTVRSQLSFTGVLLPSAGPYDFGEVQLRASMPNDRELVPESLVGQLNSTDSTAQQTTINYAGDVVAEFQMPYEVRFSKKGLNAEPTPWPEDLMKVNRIDEIATRLRASLLLATEREHRVQIALSWQNTDDPLNGPVIGWSDTHAFVGLMPTTLTEDEVERWEEWHSLLSAPGAERINLAVSRVVRATGERRDPVDVLIDSVIAWENLFGTKDGEPTLRVTASLAILLESEPSKRRGLRSELGKIYGLRSNAVHGTAMPKPSETQLCFRALDVAILAIRALLKDRPDVLAEPDGGARSLALILGVERADSARDSSAR